jgi:hypothetical protein
MTNKNHGDNPTDRERPDPDPKTPMPPAAPAQGEVAKDSEATSENQQETAKELAREFRWIEVGTLIINGVLAIVGIIALCIYHGQLEVMRGQLGEISKQYPELVKSAAAAKDASDLARHAMHIDQRSWLSMKATSEPLGTYVAGQKFDIRIHTKNSGRTPAINVKEATFRFYSPKIKGAFPYPSFTYKDTDYVSYGSIAPDSESFSDFDFGILSEKAAEQIRTEQIRVYLYGRVEYSDVFGRPHWLNYCQFLLSGGAYGICPIHNDSDLEGEAH